MSPLAGAGCTTIEKDRKGVDKEDVNDDVIIIILILVEQERI